LLQELFENFRGTIVSRPEGHFSSGEFAYLIAQSVDTDLTVDTLQVEGVVIIGCKEFIVVVRHSSSFCLKPTSAGVFLRRQNPDSKKIL
jgi:hypothetical protein